MQSKYNHDFFSSLVSRSGTVFVTGNIFFLMSSAGAQSGGCRFNKKPQYRYSGCHWYDGSALNIVLGLKFGFDEGQYTYRGHEKFFRKVGPDVVAAEMAGLDGNATESTVMTRDGI